MTNKNHDVADHFADAVESGVTKWVRNDRTFNFLRSTGARITLALVTCAVLYGFGAWAFFHAPATWWYVVALFIVGLAQKLSVRFAFDDDSVIDEYQHRRRNAAYRRAYKRVALIVGVGVLALLAWGYVGANFSAQSSFWPLPNAHFTVDLTSSRVVVLGAFGLGLFGLQKYLSWGFRGEPKA
jgi:hypothetical protein